MPAGSAFARVLDQKLDDVASWAEGSPKGARRTAIAADPSARAALWPGMIPNPFGVHAFACASPALPDMPAVSAMAAPGARRDGPRASLVEPLPAEPVLSRRARPSRPHVVLRIRNMQQRLALAEFADAGVPRDAREVSLDALRDAYRRLARAHHPDRHHVGSEAARAAHAARFARVASAYRILTAA